MPLRCVFDCRHPLWGGDGICINSDDPTVDATCSCGAGFSSRDGAGYPNCVPRAALVTFYTILAVSALMTTAFLLSHAYQYRYLSYRCRSTRRASIRIQVLVSGSGCSFGMGLVGLSLAIRSATTAFWDPGVVQAVYCVFIPMIVFACSMLAGFWVETLPSQLLPPDSFAAKLKEAAISRNLFFFIGWLSMGCSFSLGFLTFFFHPVWPARISDSLSAVGGIITVLLIIFVATQMTLFINTSSAKASASSQAFYAKAKKSIRSQATVLTLLGALHSAAAATRHLTALGKATPLLFNVLQFGTGFVALCVFARFTTFTSPNKETGSIAKPAQTLIRVKPMPASKVVDQQRQCAGISNGRAGDADRHSSSRVAASYTGCGGTGEKRSAAYLEA